jgi:endo-1,4-beta-xylanase
MKKIILLFLLVAFSQCGIKDSVATKTTPTKSTVNTPEVLTVDCNSLKLKALADFPVGVAYGTSQKNSNTEPYINSEFNSVTLTQFFTSQLWIGIDSNGNNIYTFDKTSADPLRSEADRQVDYAFKKGFKIHATSLIYPLEEIIVVNGKEEIKINEGVTPRFLFTYSGDNLALENILKNYLVDVLTHFKGKVEAYEITNELIGYDNTGNSQSTWLRRRFPTGTAGENEYYDFIGRLFGYAHAADPAAILFYNENSQEHSENNYIKGRKTVEILNKWIAKGVVQGYSIQMHTNIYRPLKDIESAFKTAATTGLKIKISELDVTINHADYDIAGVKGGGQGLTAATPALLQAQRKKYVEVVNAYKRLIPKAQQYGITVWDTSDGDSWLKDKNGFDVPTMYDVNYQRKPAYYGFAEGLLTNQTYKCGL